MSTILVLHAFHAELVTFLRDMTVAEKRAEIAHYKPPHERAVRWKIVRKLATAEYPTGEEWAACIHAYAVYERAWAEYERIEGRYYGSANYKLTHAQYQTARRVYKRAYRAWEYSTSARKWHSRVCGCTEWDWRSNKIKFPEA